LFCSRIPASFAVGRWFAVKIAAIAYFVPVRPASRHASPVRQTPATQASAGRQFAAMTIGEGSGDLTIIQRGESR